MAVTKKTAARAGRRPKAEVEREFEQVRAQAEEAREESSPKAQELERMRETEIREAVNGITVDSVLQRVSALGLDVSKALAGISEQMVGEVNRLAAARDAVEIERKELERLHRIDVAATALDQLIDEYAHKKEELEEETAGQRAAWQEESRATERERKQQEDDLKKQRQREIDEYEYKKTLERKKAQDKYDEEMRLLEKKNQEKQETLQKSWHERDAALREGEEEMARLRKESAEFPARLQAEVARAAAEAGRQSEARLDQQMLVAKKDAEAEQRLAQFRIQTLEAAVAQQAAQIGAFQKQLDEAKKQVQDIAVKAIEGASGSKALTHINEIAMEQARNRSPQG